MPLIPADRALDFAVERQTIKEVEVLLAHDIWHQDQLEDALAIAIKTEQLAIVTKLLEYGTTVTPQHLACLPSPSANPDVHELRVGIVDAFHIQKLIPFIPEMVIERDAKNLKKITALKLGPYTIHNSIIESKEGATTPLEALNSKCVTAVIAAHSNFLNGELTQFQLNTFIDALKEFTHLEFPLLEQVSGTKALVEKLYSMALYAINPELFPTDLQDAGSSIYGMQAFKDYIATETSFASNAASASASPELQAKRANFIHPIYTPEGKAILSQLKTEDILEIVTPAITESPMLHEIKQALTKTVFIGKDKLLLEKVTELKEAMPPAETAAAVLPPSLDNDDYQDDEGGDNTATIVRSEEGWEQS
jgi:hypothetical protein